MKYLFKFMSDLKLCSNSFVSMVYHFLSKSYGTSVDGEFGYFVVTSGYDFLKLLSGKKLVDNCISKLTTYGLVTKVTDNQIKETVINSYKGKDNYKNPTVYCITPLIVTFEFLNYLSKSSETKKETQIKYSIYERFIKTVKAGKSVMVAILTSLNAHKYIAEKEKVPKFKEFATLVAGYYRAYKKITTTIPNTKVT